MHEMTLHTRSHSISSSLRVPYDLSHPGLAKYSAVSAVLAVAAVYHALVTREQFYPAMVYLASSKISVALICNLGLCGLLVAQKTFTLIFFGSLRDAEVERVNEGVRDSLIEVMFVSSRKFCLMTKFPVQNFLTNL